MAWPIDRNKIVINFLTIVVFSVQIDTNALYNILEEILNNIFKKNLNAPNCCKN
jgi:hypothetical protein